MSFLAPACPSNITVHQGSSYKASPTNHLAPDGFMAKIKCSTDPLRLSPLGQMLGTEPLTTPGVEEVTEINPTHTHMATMASDSCFAAPSCIIL
eukprot:593620-Pelagomonas_calceolata.AAC.1